jgi:hypothetical protein
MKRQKPASLNRNFPHNPNPGGIMTSVKTNHDKITTQTMEGRQNNTQMELIYSNAVGAFLVEVRVWRRGTKC